MRVEKWKNDHPGRRIGFTLIGLSFIGILLMVSYFSAQEAPVHLGLTPIPAMAFLLGFVLVVSDSGVKFLDIKDELQDLPTLIADDWQALLRLRLTRAVVMLLAVIVMAVLEGHLLITYRKWFALWGPFNVIGLGLILGLVAAILFMKSEWFQWRVERTPWWIFMIPLVGFALSAGLGIHFTEPVEVGGPNRLNLIEDTYDWDNTRASRIYIFNTGTNYSGSTGSGSLDLPECNGKGCGQVYLALILIVIVAICVLGSMFIPGFWIAATLLLLFIMGVIAVRELLCVEEERKKHGQDRWTKSYRAYRGRWTDSQD
jgi:hypothetical protein